jgi:hypothetical protein
MKPLPKARTLDEIRALAESMTAMQLAALLRHIMETPHDKLGGVGGILLWDEASANLLPPVRVQVNGNAVSLHIAQDLPHLMTGEFNDEEVN